MKSQVEKHDSGKKCNTYLAPNVGLKKNQARKVVEVEMDVKSQRKSETKDPNSGEGDTEEY